MFSRNVAIPKLWLLSHYSSRGEQLQKFIPSWLDLTGLPYNYFSALGNKRNKVFYRLLRRRKNEQKTKNRSFTHASRNWLYWSLALKLTNPPVLCGGHAGQVSVGKFSHKVGAGVKRWRAQFSSASLTLVSQEKQWLAFKGTLKLRGST